MIVDTVLSCSHSSVEQRRRQPILLPLVVNGQEIVFQVDTGATCTMIGLSTYTALGSPSLEGCERSLQGYGGAPIPVKGCLPVVVSVGSRQYQLTLLVTDTWKGNNLLGLDWFGTFHLGISGLPADTISYVNQDKQLKLTEELRESFADVFAPGLGHCRAFKAHLKLKDQAVPKFFKHRPVPFARLDAVKKELDRLLTNGVLQSVSSSDWAAPIVVVPKTDGSVRICGDFKVTVNPQLEIERYPIPRMEELLFKLNKGHAYSKIDLSDAYLQIELDDASKALMVINTPFGLYRYQRLPFGVASAPAIFQRFMDQLVADLEGCVVYMDDVIVTGVDEASHLRNPDALLCRLRMNGLRCRIEKCHFFRPEIEYLGHVLSPQGIRPSTAGLLGHLATASTEECARSPSLLR